MIIKRKSKMEKKSKRQRKELTANDQKYIDEIIKRANETYRPGGIPDDAEYR